MRSAGWEKGNKGSGWVKITCLDCEVRTKPPTQAPTIQPTMEPTTWIEGQLEFLTYGERFNDNKGYPYLMVNMIVGGGKDGNLDEFCKGERSMFDIQYYADEACTVANNQINVKFFATIHQCMPNIPRYAVEKGGGIDPIADLYNMMLDCQSTEELVVKYYGDNTSCVLHQTRDATMYDIGVCQSSEGKAVEGVAGTGGGSCTGPTDVYGGLTPNAKYGSLCLHKCVDWEERKWCAVAPPEDSTDMAGGYWGWCYPCTDLPEFSCHYDAGASVYGNFKGRGRWYDGRISRVDVTTGHCKYTVQYSDGDVEVGMTADNVRELRIVVYNICDRVEGNWASGGTWYAGRIEARDGDDGDALYTVRYDDGDAETAVAAQYLRILEGQERGMYEVGQDVVGNYQGKGKWYTGEIAAKQSDCCYDINYDDGESESCVDPANIAEHQNECLDDQLVEGTIVSSDWKGYGRWYPARIDSCTSNGYNVQYFDGSTETGVMNSRIIEAPCTGNYSEGQDVHSNFKGRGEWFNGKIASVSDTCVYCVDYEDGDSECDVLENFLTAFENCDEILVGRYRIDTRVLANWKDEGQWYEGSICGCSTKEPVAFKICYDDGDVETNVNRIRIQVQ